MKRLKVTTRHNYDKIYVHAFSHSHLHRVMGADVFLCTDETGEPVGRVVELQLADHSKGWVNPKSTSKPNTLSKSHSSGRREKEAIRIDIVY